MKIREVLQIAALELSEYSDTARLDAEILLADLLDKNRTWLIAENEALISEDDLLKFNNRIARRKRFEPVAYITNIKEFFGLDFYVDQHVLVPRPETELMVEEAIKYASSAALNEIRILELGTGSGCISVALAKNLKDQQIKFKILALDIDEEALGVSAGNIYKHGLKDSITLLKSNWFSALPETEKFDIIIANPPYVPAVQSETSPEIKYEPQHAIFSGSDGLDSIKVILENIDNYVNNKAVFFCEMSYDHKTLVEDLVKEKFSNTAQIHFYKDLAGLDRFFSLTLYGKEK